MKVHFIAIGGSAMHNLAIALHLKHYVVSGSDDEIFEPSASRLAAHGLLPASWGWFPEKISPDLDAVILGMHARADNPELIRAQELNLRIFSYPEYLYEQSKSKKRVVIGGSHGKTTITSMILHVLNQAGLAVDYMVGAQLDGFDVMVRLSDDAEWIVLEGDEYLTSPLDRRPKFLHYKPHIALVSGIGWDHINVFPTFETYLEQFRLFIQAIEPGGCLIYNDEDQEVVKLVDEADCEKLPYQTHPFVVEDEKTSIITEDGKLIAVKVFGVHNMSNLAAAVAVCVKMGLKKEVVLQALASFKGASKRLECLGESPGAALYRDFAHAPSKLKASAAALRLKYPQHQLILCFELHTFSSLSASFIDQYANSLSVADRAVVFYDHHAVELKKLDLMHPEVIRKAFAQPDLEVVSEPDALLNLLQSRIEFPVVIALMSSGSFRGLRMDELRIKMGL